MLKSIAIQNFKAFSQRTEIDLAPITLIFGQNSAGKSSILQVLSLLKQTRESREAGAPLLPRAEGGIADLGSFQELLFDHDLSRTLSIGLQVHTPPGRFDSHILRQILGDRALHCMGLSLQFRRPAPDDEVQVAAFSIDWPELQEPLASFSTRELLEGERRQIAPYYWHPSRSRRQSLQRRLRAATCGRLSDSPHLWETIYSAWRTHGDTIVKALESLRQDLPSGAFPFLPDDDEDNSAEAEEYRAGWQRSLKSASQFYSRPFTFEQFVSRMTSETDSAVVAMHGFIPVRLHRPVVAHPELFAMSFGRSQEHNKLPVLDVTHLATFIGHMLEESLESLFPMGPFRRPPERWYIFTGSSPEDVGYRGDLLPDLLFRRPELVEEANQWLDRLDIGYSLRVRPVGGSSGDLFEMRLVDRKREQEVDVALSDVGFGISQILPFVVQSLASREQVISIEQPEVHLHPKLQADLGDLLATAIGEPYKHQFLVETHSEHLVLRLQKLVRMRKLDPEDVSVIFVSRGSGGSIARRLHIDTDGRFVDEWPGGFFAERLRELV